MILSIWRLRTNANRSVYIESSMCLRYVYIFVGFYPLRSFWPKAYMFFFIVVWRDPSPKPIPKLSEVVVHLGLQLPVQLSEAKT